MAYTACTDFTALKALENGLYWQGSTAKGRGNGSRSAGNSCTGCLAPGMYGKQSRYAGSISAAGSQESRVERRPSSIMGRANMQGLHASLIDTARACSFMLASSMMPSWGRRSPVKQLPLTPSGVSCDTIMAKVRPDDTPQDTTKTISIGRLETGTTKTTGIGRMCWLCSCNRDHDNPRRKQPAFIGWL